MFNFELDDKESRIITLIAENSRITVAQMGDQLGVSAVTIRKDLTKLEKMGLITRTRGGATLAFHPEIAVRQNENVVQKNKIAERAAKLISDGDSVMINSSTTGVLIAKYLEGKRNVRIITSSTLFLPFARINPELKLTMLGGELRVSTEAIIGTAAINQLDSLYASIAFIGTSGFSPENGVTAHAEDEALIVKKMTERSDKTALLADSSKFGKSSFIKFLELTDIDLLVTDDGLPEDKRKRLVDLGIEVIIA